ncbi:VOC family protein [Heyndrickxia sp. NPDC080065]|uniref:VOC family protein n=1 Tax=Heyndrickxia sp. NPDC080065 TaxID=3390568 RepID=UPI003D06D8A9
MLNQVGVLSIQVHNMEKSVDFYTNVLGFEISKRYGENIVTLKQEAFTIVLETAEEVHTNPKQYVLPGIISENLDGDIVNLKSKGVKMVFDEPRPCPPGRYTIIEDPTGNQLELIEFSK